MRTPSILSRLSVHSPTIWLSLHARKCLSVIWMACFPLLIIGLTSSTPLSFPPARPFEVQITAEQIELLRTGDVIFRRSTGVGSNYIVSVDQASPYSHSGIVRVADGQVTVIHASSNTDSLGAYVHEVTIAEFLKDVPMAAVYRLTNQDNAAAEQAVRFSLNQIGKPFDFQLDLQDTSAYYCTELIWAAYMDAGVDLLDGKFDHLTLPLIGESEYILLSSLAGSPYLTPVLTLPCLEEQ